MYILVWTPKRDSPNFFSQYFINKNKLLNISSTHHFY